MIKGLRNTDTSSMHQLDNEDCLRDSSCECTINGLESVLEVRMHIS